MRRYSSKYSGEDNDRRSISDTGFGDDVPEPEKDHRPCRNEEHRWKYDTPEVRSIDNLRATISCADERIEEVDHPVALRECEWDREIACIVVDLLLSLFSFLLQ